MADLNNTNIYDLVGKLNENKVSDNTKLDEIYNMLDSLNSDGTEKKSSDIKLTLNNDASSTYSTNKVDNSTNATTRSKKKTATLSDYKDKVKTIKRPSFPTEIKAYDTRSECFFNILDEVDYGTNNNSDYVDGHKAAISKYYTVGKNNAKNLYVVEGQVHDELNVTKSDTDNFAKGYYDGLSFVYTALNKSKDLLSKKIYDDLLKELG